MSTSSSLYQKSGVSIDAGQETVKLIKEAVKSTHNENVLAGVGAFAGLFDLTNLPDNPAIVASTDGVGTKVKLAAQAGKFKSIGHDIVNHCFNDIACAGQGVKPLFFLDYVASSELKPQMVAEIVTGISEACKHIGAALLGGETAEMPSLYQENEFDLVGTIIGVVDKTKLYPKSTLKIGDKLIGLPSSGAHTNGYSLIRKVFADVPLDSDVEGVGHLDEVLLEPHRNYYPELAALQEANIEIQALAHITGGGLIENLPRVLPNNLTALIKRNSWQVPNLFKYIQENGKVSDLEMYRVFNMGVGMVVIVPETQLNIVLQTLPRAFCIGEILEGAEIKWDE